MDIERLQFLARLPLFLTSSMSTKKVIEIAIDRLRQSIDAEAVTVFLRDEQSEELVFWAIQGSEKSDLEGTRMPLRKGIVGWVMQNQQSLRIDDVASDPRFFEIVDKESNFKTKNMICAPLVVRGDNVLGAVQCLNKRGLPFTPEDLEFLEQCANQISLAVHNSLLYEKLAEENMKLQTLHRRKDEMLSVISHEIRTPLTAIQGSAEIIALQSDTENPMMQMLTRGVARLADLTSQIRNATFLCDKNLTTQRQLCSLSELYDLLQNHFQIPLRDRQISLSISLSDPTVKINADFGLIVIALKNLLSNAIRFTPNHGSIMLSATVSKGLVECAVTDTGIGMTEEEIPLIFEKFYEIGSAQNHSSGDYQFKSAGLGLGLAATKAIVEAHESILKVKSRPNEGTTVSFCIRST